MLTPILKGQESYIIGLNFYNLDTQYHMRVVMAHGFVRIILLHILKCLLAHDRSWPGDILLWRS